MTDDTDREDVADIGTGISKRQRERYYAALAALNGPPYDKSAKMHFYSATIQYLRTHLSLGELPQYREEFKSRTIGPYEGLEDFYDSLTPLKAKNAQETEPDVIWQAGKTLDSVVADYHDLPKNVVVEAWDPATLEEIHERIKRDIENMEWDL